ncbi:MAG: ferrous iron transport protein B [Gemmatimonadaceae bacterium]|nr:ferrous iron transport protein B [Gemmatimonadaceae bacterium]NUQ94910.1 ferrous iron transport protein B [Gemmatimonadaceae bacterium]NUR20377.1 ferrous iron transport protein B [Gemmatimonadaceae bacterium]NUS98868.1 ferrous iron transport protein B [Gemmatimonadaceae bacterium]
MTAVAAIPHAAHVRAGPGTDSLRVALVGNPNAGKSTLFNALTGMRQRVANFPGVTVEHAEGSYARDSAWITVLDLPGTYSLAAQSPDEAVALDVLLGRARGVPAPDVIVVVVDAVNLERNLFFATQILELGRPTVIALNRMDRMVAEGTRIDVPELIHELRTVVIPVSATRGEGIERLRHAISCAPSLPPAPARIGLGDEMDVERRYAWIADVVERCVVRRTRSARTTSDRVDAVLLHRVWGPLIFLGILLLAFQAMFSAARPLADGIESLVAVAGALVTRVLPAGDLRSLLVDGVLAGVGSVLVFLPQIAILFLLIGLLEDSGYMARAAFAVDRYVRPLGLQGRSFVPLVSGYACAVPGIMATRTIQQREERLATIMVVPLMSCSARLPVYALLIAAFVPAVRVAGVVSLQSLTMLGMYLLGTVAALGMAAIFRRTLLRSDTRALIMELPRYSLPSPRVLLASVWQRVRIFLRRAGTVIFAISVLLWALARYPQPSTPTPPTPEAQLGASALGRIGHAIEPAVRPLGYDWKIGVSMIASFAAREVFVSTMGTIYSASAEEGGPALAQRLRGERDSRGRAVYTPLVAIGLMVFYVFALMCTSTIAITIRETGGGWRGLGWAALQFGYMLALAYGGALLVYRGGLALGLGGGG